MTDGTWHFINKSLITGVVTSAFAYSSLCKKQKGLFMCLRSGESLIRQYVKKHLLAFKLIRLQCVFISLKLDIILVQNL